MRLYRALLVSMTLAVLALGPGLSAIQQLRPNWLGPKW
jgi:hypothetical protein